MRKRLNIALDENPFIYIRIRSLFLYFILAIVLVVISFTVLLVTWGLITNNKTILENPDPIFVSLLRFYAYLMWFVFIVYQFRRVGTNWNYLIGKIPKNFNWSPLLFLALIRFLFSIGMFRVTYYPIYFLFPNWIESILINTNAIQAQNSFSPTIYYCLNYLFYFSIRPLSDILVFLIFFLYCFTLKYNTNKAILITCLIGGLLGYRYPLEVFVRILIMITLYLKHRNLIVPLVFMIFGNFIYLIWNLLSKLFFVTDNNNLIENFQAQLPLGIFFVAISAPYLVYWLYENRIKESDELPYFVNQTEAQKG